MACSFFFFFAHVSVPIQSVTETDQKAGKKKRKKTNIFIKIFLPAKIHMSSQVPIPLFFFLRDRLHELYILGTANVCINLEKKQEEQNMKNE